MEKKIVLFMPSVEGGGVEKNFFIISNFLKKKLKIHLLSQQKKIFQKKLKKEILFTQNLIFGETKTDQKNI